MYCSTCGAAVAAGRTRCTECGTRVPRAERGTALEAPRRPDALRLQDMSVRDCPRCGYQGEGLPYFSRGSHVAALVGATVLTAGAMGAGGLVYYVVRREHQVCPRCGYGWGKYGERSRVAGSVPAVRGPRAAELARPDREGMKTAFSWIFFLLAAMMLIPLIAGGEAVALVFGGLFAGGGYLLRRSAETEREARRAALLSKLQMPVLRLAAERGGRLTVTSVAAELGWTMPRAEKVLNSLEDGIRVCSDVTDEGVIVYEFREILNAPRAARPLPEGGDRDPDGPPRLYGDGVA